MSNQMLVCLLKLHVLCLLEETCRIFFILSQGSLASVKGWNFTRWWPCMSFPPLLLLATWGHLKPIYFKKKKKKKNRKKEKKNYFLFSILKKFKAPLSEMFIRWKMKVKVLVAQLSPTLLTPWTAAHQAPLSMGFSRQEHWSGLPFPSLGDLPYSGIEPGSHTLQAT